VRVDELGEVHAVDVVAGENQVVVGIDFTEVAGGLSDGVGRALEPVFALRRLLRGQHFDEPLREQIHPVGLRDVPVERGRVELGQDVDPFEPRMQAVAERYVDQPVLAADRNGRLRSLVGEREEARPAAAAEDEREHVVHRATFYAACPRAVGRRHARPHDVVPTDDWHEPDRGRQHDRLDEPHHPREPTRRA
jgi:hypothetical protein